MMGSFVICTVYLITLCLQISTVKSENIIRLDLDKEEMTSVPEVTAVLTHFQSTSLRTAGRGSAVGVSGSSPNG